MRMVYEGDGGEDLLSHGGICGGGLWRLNWGRWWSSTKVTDLESLMAVDYGWVSCWSSKDEIRDGRFKILTPREAGQAIYLSNILSFLTSGHLLNAQRYICIDSCFLHEIC
ncbi:OLC1v1015660C1 [Oldenlandia corymbosa var. corymbosa]|uniref:OLC1v1015660C1 n=1 Tax=Oldenlandia corymbosa var. corymbosa TaxID=529605 RepID=A0AAV1E3Y9_OLDCO|nr:OLC1v1015660C1 [Oldenlandia corymbosa var. corymbosa]